MKYAFLILFVFLGELAFAGPGGTGRPVKVSFEVDQTQGARFALQAILAVGKDGDLIVQVVDSEGSPLILHIQQEQLIPVGSNHYEVLSKVDGI